MVGSTATGMRFELEVRATKPLEALEKAYSLIGSRHRLKRGQIELQLQELRPEEVAEEEARLLESVDRVARY